MNILLTGSSGFIGSFLKDRSEVKRIVTRTNDCLPNHFYINSLSKDTNWDNAFDGVKCIIHLAGLAHSNQYTDTDYYSINTDGTLKLAREAAKSGVKRFVFVSTIGVNGSSTEPNKKFLISSKPNPNNLYACSKLKAELGLKEISKETGLEVVIVRPTLVYGLNAPGNFGLLTSVIKKTPISPFGSVHNKRNFIAVQNLVDLLLICSKHPDAAGQTFLASDGASVSTKEFIDAMADGLQKSIYQLPVPVALMRLGAKFIRRSTIAEQLFNNLEVDSSNAQCILGWHPPYTMKQAMANLSRNTK